MAWRATAEVTQIFNLLYRALSPNLIRQGVEFPNAPQSTTLRYSVARRSRNQNDPTTDEHG